jgi:hypothetical protein
MKCYRVAICVIFSARLILSTDLNATRTWENVQYFARMHDDLSGTEALHLCRIFDSIEDLSGLSKVDKSRRDVTCDATRNFMACRRRVLFLTTKRSLLLMMDRWFFALYLAMNSIRNFEVIIWGTGFPGFNDNHSTKENIERWFEDPNFDVIQTTWTYQRTRRGLRDAGSASGLGHAKSRAREFQSLPGDPIVIAVVHEVSMQHDELLVQPNILLTVYEQQMGLTRSDLIDTCGYIPTSSVATRNSDQDIASSSGSDSSRKVECEINPFLSQFLKKSPKTLIAYMPLFIRPEKFKHHLMKQSASPYQRESKYFPAGGPPPANTSNGKPLYKGTAERITELQSSDNKTGSAGVDVRAGNVILVGATNAKIYPLRAAGNTLCG